MPDVEKEVEVGDLKFIAKVNARIDFDGFILGLIRYRLDPARRHVLESHYWSPDGNWTNFPLGGMFPEIRVPSLQWPQWAHELTQHVREWEAKQILMQAIDEAEKQSKSQHT